MLRVHYQTPSACWYSRLTLLLPLVGAWPLAALRSPLHGVHANVRFMIGFLL